MFVRFLIGTLFITFLSGGNVRADTLLFSSHEVLEMAIPLDFKTLCRPRESENCDYAPTRLEYVDEHGEAQSIPIEIKTRGGWRSLTQNCSAPLLFVRFSGDKTADTPFAGQTMLPLTTHCGQGLSLDALNNRVRPSQWGQYLLKEYLAHLLYNEITDLSIKARLVRMTYPNPLHPNRKTVSYAFFTEHFESVAARNNSAVLKRTSFDPQSLDLEAANLLALFQFMIGNTDWSIARERNVVLLKGPDGRHSPLPFDFDMSGLVNAHYAGPAPRLSIDEVTERIYLGYCNPAADWDQLLEPYLSNQLVILAKMDEIPGLNKQSTKASKRFLEKFFEILHSDELIKSKIIEQCLPWPPGPEDHTSPLD
jgi:hypothetical protein